MRERRRRKRVGSLRRPREYARTARLFDGVTDFYSLALDARGDRLSPLDSAHETVTTEEYSSVLGTGYCCYWCYYNTYEGSKRVRWHTR